MIGIWRFARLSQALLFIVLFGSLTSASSAEPPPTALDRGKLPVESQWDPVATKGSLVENGEGARFTVLTPALIRMEWSSDRKFEDRPSLAIVNRRLPKPGFKVDRTESELVIATDELVVRYSGRSRFGKENLSVTIKNAGGGKPRTWHPGDSDSGNLKGTIRTLDMVSGAAPLPNGLLSRDGWAVVDDSEKIVLDGGVRGWVTPRELATNAGRETAQDLYFFGHGHDYKRALRDYASIAGRVPLPPRWAFGSWWSRYWPYHDYELKNLVGEFRTHEVPLDVLVIDMDWHLDGWTGYTWNPKYFPDPDGFLKWARDEGLKITLNLHPADGVKKHEKAFPQFARNMGIDPSTTDSVYFDCTSPRFVRNYFDLLHRPLQRQGVDFWWIDWQQGTGTSMSGLDPLPWINQLHWRDMQDDAALVSSAGEHLRPLLFSRWGGFGSHRYPTGFSGDTYNNWESLAFQPYFTSTAGNVLYPYWSHDIGGHQPGPVGAELYARWIQWAAFNPIVRTHGGVNPGTERRIWAFPAEEYAAMKAAWLLRYSLIPYIYTAARKCYDDALPLLRPLYYEWPELDDAYKYTNQYLFGDDLLVNPVVEPTDPNSSCTVVTTWIPPGKWINWFSGEETVGPKTIDRMVPLEEIPVWARAGSIIPTQRVQIESASDDRVSSGAARNIRNNTEANNDGTIVLHVFPGAAGSCELYEDDGETIGYESGKFSRTPISQVTEFNSGVTTVTIGQASGNWTSASGGRNWEVVYHTGANASSATAVTKPAASLSSRRTDRNEAKAGSADRPSTMTIVFRAADSSIPNSIGASTAGVLAAATTPLGKAAAERRSLLRRLGVTSKLEIRETSGSEIEADLGIGVFSQTTGLKVRVTDVNAIVEAGGIIAPTPHEIELPPNQVTHVKRILNTATAANEIPQNKRLGLSVELSRDDLQVSFPLETTIRPSINAWWIVGPFENTWEDALKRVHRPETDLLSRPDAAPDPDKTYAGKNGAKVQWRKLIRPVNLLARDELRVDLHRLFGVKVDNGACYAVTYLNSPRDTSATLAIGSDDGAAAWIGTKEVWRHETGRSYSSTQDRAPIFLKKGSNRVLLKINQGSNAWEFGAHLLDETGASMTDVKVQLEP